VLIPQSAISSMRNVCDSAAIDAMSTRHAARQIWPTTVIDH
jgi:hypothetical protein